MQRKATNRDGSDKKKLSPRFSLFRLTEEGLNLPRLHVIYYPQIGYLLVVENQVIVDASIDASEESFARVGLDYMFSSPTHFYYKSRKMHELDRELGDIHGAITVSLPHRGTRGARQCFGKLFVAYSSS